MDDDQIKQRRVLTDAVKNFDAEVLTRSATATATILPPVDPNAIDPGAVRTLHFEPDPNVPPAVLVDAIDPPGAVLEATEPTMQDAGASAVGFKRKRAIDICDHFSVFDDFHMKNKSKSQIADDYNINLSYVDEILSRSAAKTRAGRFYEQLELVTRFEAGATRGELKEIVWKYQGMTSKNKTGKHMGDVAIDTVLKKEYIDKLKSIAVKKCIARYLQDNPGNEYS